MNENDQRIAIAEACGVPFDICMCGDGEASHRMGRNEHTFSPMAELPDYLHDLNAMHESETILSQEQQLEYAYQLSELACPITGEEWQLLHAPAAQRAEAFLKTIGKWTDDPTTPLAAPAPPAK